MTEAPVASGGEAGTVKLRGFVAVPLPPRMQVEILEAAWALAAALPGVKWSRKVENLHITLNFLGEVPVNRLEALAAALIEESAPRETFSLTVRGLGAFPDERHAATIWAGIEDGEGRLGEVATSVERLVDRLGLGPARRERRPFRPHVTVGRCKTPGGVDARQTLDPWRSHSFGTLIVAALHVYESQLGGTGSTYVLRGRAPLL